MKKVRIEIKKRGELWTTSCPFCPAIFADTSAQRLFFQAAGHLIFRHGADKVIPLIREQ